MKLDKPVSYLHICLGIMIWIPFSISWLSIPSILGNLAAPEQTYFMLYLVWPMGASIIPFCIYFALFTKPRFVKTERSEDATKGSMKQT